MHRSRARLLPRTSLAALAVAALLSACATEGSITRSGPADGSRTERPTDTSGGASPGSPADGDLVWGSCKDAEIALPDQVLDAAETAGMECGTLAVPVDPDDPDGRTIDLAVGILAAEGSSRDRIGSLVVNPGGPGGSGLEFLASAGLMFPEELRERFDVVSFDPRGIAASSPLDCLTQSERADAVDTESPDDPQAAVARADELERAIAAGCENDDADLFVNMGTDAVVADLDLLREALGDEQLTFLGLSYGTRIAAAYATEFPDRVRALVLDGSVTPSRDPVDSSAGQAKGIIRAVQAFADGCNADPTCALAPDAMGRMAAVAAQLDAAPVELDDEQLTKDKFVTGVITAMYDPSVAAALADAVAALEGTDADARERGGRFLAALAGQQSSKQPDGTYGNGFEAQTVVNCLDSDGPLDAADLPRVRELVGPIPAFLDTDPAADTPNCVHLPTGDDLQLGPTTATSRILIVGTQGDPATPIEWTSQMATALGSPQVIVYGGSGHTASLNRECVTTQVTTFFVDGALTSPTDCPRDPAEADIYALFAQQFAAMGLGDDVAQCIADGLRSRIDPLELVGMSDDDVDPALMRTMTEVALGCR